MIRSPWTCLGLIFLLLVATAGADSLFEMWLPKSVATFCANLFLLASAFAISATVETEPQSAGTTPRKRAATLSWLGGSLLCITWINVSGSWYLAQSARASLEKACSPNVETWSSLAQGLLISPVVEELMITGLFFSLLRSRYALSWAIAFASVAFALLHFPGNAVQFANRIAFETLSCLLLLRTGHLFASIALHVMTNSALFLVDRMEQSCRYLLSIDAPYRELWVAGLVAVAGIAVWSIHRQRSSLAGPGSEEHAP